MAHAIEPAPSGRSRCHSCEAPIAEGELRLAEAFVRDDGAWARAHKTARTQQPRYDEDSGWRRDDAINPDLGTRFHHLACAARHQPYKLRSALAGATVEVPDRAALEALIARALQVVDLAEEAEASRAEYQHFLAQLRARDDDAARSVFADWLQNQGDPRGELMAVQRQLETAAPKDRAPLLALEQKLLGAHRDRFVPDRFEGALTWRAGFVHRLALTTVTSLEKTTLARGFAHPSFRLLRELSATVEGAVIAANLPRPLPSTLRVLELTCFSTSNFYQRAGLGDVAALLVGAQLERLVLTGACELALASQTLRVLELGARDANEEEPVGAASSASSSLLQRLPSLTHTSLPALTQVSLRVSHDLDAALEALATTTLAPQLEVLGLHGDLSARGLALLSSFPALKRLDARECSGLTRAELDALKLEVVREVAPAPLPEKTPRALTEWKVRHTRKPEWGVGTVVGEGDAGLEVDFEKAGRKVVRNVELLEDLEE